MKDSKRCRERRIERKKEIKRWREFGSLIEKKRWENCRDSHREREMESI